MRYINFYFLVGAGQVIRGWDEGLKDMCHKEKRTLTIPSNMAYGTAFSKGLPCSFADRPF
jgi:FKBP-type peptidyl-prolyl cis-trans isomerase